MKVVEHSNVQVALKVEIIIYFFSVKNYKNTIIYKNYIITSCC